MITREGWKVEGDEFVAGTPLSLARLADDKRPFRHFAFCGFDRRGRPSYIECRPEDVMTERDA